MSWNSPAVSSPWTSRTTSPISAGVFGNSSPTSRPTILATIWDSVVSVMLSVEM